MSAVSKETDADRDHLVELDRDLALVHMPPILRAELTAMMEAMHGVLQAVDDDLHPLFVWRAKRQRILASIARSLAIPSG